MKPSCRFKVGDRVRRDKKKDAKMDITWEIREIAEDYIKVYSKQINKLTFIEPRLMNSIWGIASEHNETNTKEEMHSL